MGELRVGARGWAGPWQLPSSTALSCLEPSAVTLANAMRSSHRPRPVHCSITATTMQRLRPTTPSTQMQLRPATMQHTMRSTQRRMPGTVWRAARRTTLWVTAMLRTLGTATTACMAMSTTATLLSTLWGMLWALRPTGWTQQAPMWPPTCMLSSRRTLPLRRQLAPPAQTMCSTLCWRGSTPRWRRRPPIRRLLAMPN